MLLLSLDDQRPEMRYLTRYVRGLLCSACEENPQAWKDLGRELMPDAEAALGTIAANAHGNVINCCQSLFKQWLDRQPEASWGQLIQALRDIGLDNMAVQIEKKLEPSIASASHHTVTTTPSQMAKGMTFIARYATGPAEIDHVSAKNCQFFHDCSIIT